MLEIPNTAASWYIGQHGLACIFVTAAPSSLPPAVISTDVDIGRALTGISRRWRW